MSIVEDLRHHLATTPKEQLEKEWEDLKEWGNVGPTVSEFLGWNKPSVKWLEEQLASWFYGVRTWGLLNGESNEEFCKRQAKKAAEEILDKEQPAKEDLEEAAKQYAQQDKWMYDHFGDVVMKAVLFGASLQKERDEMDRVNYEEARIAYDNTVQHLEEKMKEKYEQGKNDMKIELMNGVVVSDGEVCKLADRVWVTADDEKKLQKDTREQFEAGDKVKIIIVRKN